MEARSCTPCHWASAWPPLRARRCRWAELLRRVFQVEVETCPRCGGAMKIVAFRHRTRRRAAHMIVDGELDELPEQAFYMRCGIEEAIEAAEKMAAGV